MLSIFHAFRLFNIHIFQGGCTLSMFYNLRIWFNHYYHCNKLLFIYVYKIQIYLHTLIMFFCSFNWMCVVMLRKLLCYVWLICCRCWIAVECCCWDPVHWSCLWALVRNNRVPFKGIGRGKGEEWNYLLRFKHSFYKPLLKRQ